MSDYNDLMQFTKLSGFRLIVLANRSLCDSAFQRDLHDRLAELLFNLAQSTRNHMAIERCLLAMPQPAELIGPPDLDDYHDQLIKLECEHASEVECYELLDDLEIDYETMEYRVNDERWCCAYSADCDGVSISYPRSVAVGHDELGSLADILIAIREETGVNISVTKVRYD